MTFDFDEFLEYFKDEIFPGDEVVEHYTATRIMENTLSN